MSFNNDTIDLMGEYIALHLLWGEMLAKINWIKCCDPDGNSRRMKNIRSFERVLRNKIRKQAHSLEFILNKEVF